MEQAEKDGSCSPASTRILDRKIESRALPSGFSSNLGRKAPTGDKGCATKSVKAIVDWLEKTTTTGPEKPGLKTPQRREKIRNVDTFSLSSFDTGKSDVLQATASEPTVPSPVCPLETTPTHPEEYSLTLFEYKTYFNNRPLGRCLDDQEDKATTPVGKSTPIAASASSCYSIQKLDSIMATLEEMQSGTEPVSPTPHGRTSRTGRTAPEEKKGAAELKAQTEDSTADMPIEGVEATMVQRDPGEIKAF